jgi:hypothetical protein
MKMKHLCSKNLAVLMIMMASGFQGICQPILTLDYYLVKYHQVDYASSNTLGSTPANIQSLVSGFDIDIRNSTYNIIHSLKEWPSWWNDIDYNNRESAFVNRIIDAMDNDNGVWNVRAEDYNDCIRQVGVDRLSRRDYGGCSFLTDSWKTRVLDALMSNVALQNSLYEWVKPELHRVVHQFDSEQMEFFVNTLNHMIDYTNRYNHQDEKNFYLNCCETEYGAGLFISEARIVNMKPVGNGVFNPYRHLEAWVFRRVEEGTMTAPQIKNWLVRIKQDLHL